MNGKATMTTEEFPRPGEAAAPKTLLIVGRNLLQNRLIKSYLNERLAAPCEIAVRDAWHEDDDAHGPPADLVLIDCFEIAPRELWQKLGLGSGPDPADRAVAFFNVMGGDNNGFEREAIERCVRGIFYAGEAPERLCKGIEKIMGGELWYSRKTTSELLMDPRRFRPRTEALEAMLTAREKEVLVAIASGAANGEIADEFNISLHTVKTHLYNIYKKIDVRNRLEATLWVARYLF
jgi:LuxR family transcriptional regulator of csgAB operon